MSTSTCGADTADFCGFKPSLRRFLRELEANNERSWFDENRERFETQVREPALAFVRAMAPRLAAISPHLLIDDNRSGGSLLRMHRDTRFSADKRPYHTTVVVRFRHTLTDPVAAPAYALRISARAVSLWAGLRVPGSHSLELIRARIDSHRRAWSKARSDTPFVAFFGDLLPPELKRVPRDYDPDHPFAEDLRRKDFRVARTVRLTDAASPDFVEEAEASWVAAEPLMRFLCDALGLPFRAAASRATRDR